MPERGRIPEEMQRSSPLAFFHMERSHVDTMVSKDLSKHFWTLRDEVLALCRANGVEHPNDLGRVPHLSVETLNRCFLLLKNMKHILSEKEWPPLLLFQEEDSDHLDYHKEDAESFSFELPAFVKTGPILDAGGKMVMTGQMPNGRWVVMNHRGNTLGNPEGYKEMGPVVYENGHIFFAAADRGVWTLFDERGMPLLTLPEHRRVEKIVRVGKKEIALLAQTKEGKKYQWLDDTGQQVLSTDFRAVDEVFAQDGQVAFIARTFEDWPTPSVWTLEDSPDADVIGGRRAKLPTKTTPIQTTWIPRGQPTTKTDPVFSQPEIKKVFKSKNGNIFFGIREHRTKNQWYFAQWRGVGEVLLNEELYPDILAVQDDRSLGLGLSILSSWRDGFRWIKFDGPMDFDLMPSFYELEKIFFHPGQTLCAARPSKNSKRVHVYTRTTGNLKLGHKEGYASVEDALCMGGAEKKHYVFAARSNKNDAQCGIYIQLTFAHDETLVGSMDRVDRLGTLSDGRFYAIGREGKNMVKRTFDVKMKD
jgi:hypothetical protein